MMQIKFKYANGSEGLADALYFFYTKDEIRVAVQAVGLGGELGNEIVFKHEQDETVGLRECARLNYQSDHDASGTILDAGK